MVWLTGQVFQNPALFPTGYREVWYASDKEGRQFLRRDAYEFQPANILVVFIASGRARDARIPKGRVNRFRVRNDKFTAAATLF